MLSTSKVNVNNLQIGMYVAQLDRPWLETPFLFQGFYIREPDEIQELQKYCDFVYVLLDSGEEPDVSIDRAPEPGGHTGRAAGRRKKPWFRFGSRQRVETRERPQEARERRFTEAGLFYEETASFEEELRSATGVHETAVDTINGVMSELQLSGKLNIRGLETAVSPMVNSILRNPAALACLVRLQNKGEYLYHHSLASLVWATILGRHIGLNREDLNVIALGALVLDVGKTRIPDEILRKPGKLDEDERKLMKRHVEFGLNILQETGTVDDRVVDMVTHHHERYNGAGYPAGLKGNQVPVFGRIAGLVDSYDAMITPRPYAEPLSSYDAFRQLRALADVEFQAEMIDQFTQAIGVFPTGTLVELNTGEVGVVTRQNRTRRLRPEIMLVMNEDKQFLDLFDVVDLNDESTTSESGYQSLWIERGLAPGSFGIDPTEFYLD